jgi:hypothetical protein
MLRSASLPRPVTRPTASFVLSNYAQRAPTLRRRIIMTEQQVVFDQQKQLDLVREGLQQGEEVIAVYDAIGAGTGFIGLTDRRAIVQDNSFVGKRVALTSIPFSQITSVSFVTNKSMFGRLASNSAIAIHTASKTYEVEFRGENKGKHVHDIILWKILQ